MRLCYKFIGEGRDKSRPSQASVCAAQASHECERGTQGCARHKRIIVG